MQLDLLIALVGLISALTIDFFNLTLIVKLWKWSKNAVDNIISEATTEIIKRVNLQVGKSGSTMDKLVDKFSQSIETANQDVPEGLKNLNLPLLFAKIQSGNMDIKDFIPIAAKILGSSGNNRSNSGNGSGKWD